MPNLCKIKEDLLVIHAKLIHSGKRKINKIITMLYSSAVLLAYI